SSDRPRSDTEAILAGTAAGQRFHDVSQRDVGPSSSEIVPVRPRSERVIVGESNCSGYARWILSTLELFESFVVGAMMARIAADRYAHGSHVNHHYEASSTCCTERLFYFFKFWPFSASIGGRACDSSHQYKSQ